MRFPTPARPESAAALAALVDHVFLSPAATTDEVSGAATEAANFGCAAVCVSPARLPLETSVTVCAMVGYPAGTHAPEVKSAEAAYAVIGGAAEIEMVVDHGLVKAGAWTDLEDEIALVRGACGEALLKVVVEGVWLTDDEMTRSAEAAGRAGASYVVTSADYRAVRLIRDVVGDELGVKVSGISTAAQALSSIDAGASRIGSDQTGALLRSFDATR